MKRAALAAAFGLLLARGASAQSARVAEREPPVAPDDAYLQCPAGATCLPIADAFPARWMELMPVLVSHLTYDEELAFRTGVGFEMALLPRRAQWFRPALYSSTTFGSWGDREHDVVSLENGLKARFSFLADRQLFDAYAVVGAGAVVAPVADALGARFSVGPGLRGLRAFTAEVTFDVVVDPAGGFGQERSKVAVGPGVLLGMDVCSFGRFCDYAEDVQRREDSTCCAYRDAWRACTAAGARREPLCRAVDEGMDTPLLCRALDEARLMDQDECFADPVGALVRYLMGRHLPIAGADPVGRALEALLATHERQSRRREAGLREEREASQRGRTLALHRVYSPYSTDLRRWLGCDGELAKTPCTEPTCRAAAACAER